MILLVSFFLYVNILVVYSNKKYICLFFFFISLWVSCGSVNFSWICLSFIELEQILSFGLDLGLFYMFLFFFQEQQLYNYLVFVIFVMQYENIEE